MSRSSFSLMRGLLRFSAEMSPSGSGLCIFDNMLFYNSYGRGVMHHAMAEKRGGCFCCHYSARGGGGGSYARRGVDRSVLFSAILAILGDRVRRVTRLRSVLTFVSKLPRSACGCGGVGSRVRHLSGSVRSGREGGRNLCSSLGSKLVAGDSFAGFCSSCRGSVGSLRATIRECGVRLRTLRDGSRCI